MNPATAAPLAATNPHSGKRVVLTLVLVVFGAVLLAMCSSAMFIEATGRRGWWSGWIAALVISILATGASLVPVGLGLALGTQSAVYGYLGGVTARLMVTMFGTLAAVYLFGAPVFTTLILLMPPYLAALIVECAALWRIFTSGDSRSRMN